MFAYGVFFERYGNQTRLDLVVTQDQAERILDKKNDDNNILGSGIDAFVVQAGIRSEFKNIGDLVHRARKSSTIIIDDEEWLFVVASTRAKARQMFIDACDDSDLEEQFA